jgi:hypothetical protein
MDEALESDRAVGEEGRDAHAQLPGSAKDGDDAAAGFFVPP